MSDYYTCNADWLTIDLFGDRHDYGSLSLSSSCQVSDSNVEYFYGKIKSSISFLKLKIRIEFATEDMKNAEACRTSSHLVFMEGWHLLCENLSAQMLEEHFNRIHDNGVEFGKAEAQRKMRKALGVS